MNQISVARPKPKRRVSPKFEFTLNELITEVAPDKNKVFSLNEEIVNQKYTKISGIMEWLSGDGGGITYFEGQEKQIFANWLDNQTLEIRHEKGLFFTKRDEECSFRGDKVTIKYIED